MVRGSRDERPLQTGDTPATGVRLSTNTLSSPSHGGHPEIQVLKTGTLEPGSMATGLVATGLVPATMMGGASVGGIDSDGGLDVSGRGACVKDSSRREVASRSGA